MECSECHTELPLKVLQSAAGYYVGYWCPNCGPYDRLTDYYQTPDEASTMLLQMVRA